MYIYFTSSLILDLTLSVGRIGSFIQRLFFPVFFFFSIYLFISRPPQPVRRGISSVGIRPDDCSLTGRTHNSIENPLTPGRYIICGGRPKSFIKLPPPLRRRRGATVDLWPNGRARAYAS